MIFLFPYSPLLCRPTVVFLDSSTVFEGKFFGPLKNEEVLLAANPEVLMARPVEDC